MTPEKPEGKKFLTHLLSATDDSPPEVQAIVKRSMAIQKFKQVLEFYEIRNRYFAEDVIASLAKAASDKMADDADKHVVGSTTFADIILQVAAFAFISGAHLAKEKKI